MFAILSVFNANYMAAAIAILVAMIFDVLDGKSASLTNSTSHFGLEYDSLSDVVSFGVAPGLLIYSWALSGQGTFGVAVMFAYVAMGAVRLARFNSTVALVGREILYRIWPFRPRPGWWPPWSFSIITRPDGRGGQADPRADHDVGALVFDGEHHQVSELQRSEI